METKKTRYADYNINYHFVWIPKYRCKILVGPIAKELEQLIQKVCDEREVVEAPAALPFGGQIKYTERR